MLYCSRRHLPSRMSLQARMLYMNNSPISTWCNRLIQVSFYLLFGIVPLLLTPWNFELFEYNKMMAVYILTIVIGVSWIIKSLNTRELRVAKTPLDIPILLFAASQLVSAVFSIDPHVSWLGYYSRFNGGMWSVASYILLYYALVSNTDVFIHAQKSKNQATPLFSTFTTLLSITLMSAAIVAVYGVLERLGIDKNLWVQDVQNRVFSTLGQPNWLAAYIVALVPLAMAMGIQQLTSDNLVLTRKNTKPDWIRPSVYGTLSLLLFVVLLFTRSRSGLMGFFVADVAFWIIVILTSPGVKKLKDTLTLPFMRPVGIIHLLFALIVFINGTGTPAIDRFVTLNGLISLVTTSKTTSAAPAPQAAGPALEVGGTESGTIRKYVWQGAINAWKSTTKTMLIGTGTETFAFAFYQFRPVGHNLTSEWDFLYNKAHNEYLNFLATTGLFGLGSYLSFIVVFVLWFVAEINKERRAQKKEGDAHDRSVFIVRASLFAGWLSILVTNFFGFSVVILQVFLFLFPAIIAALQPSGILSWTKKLETPRWILWPILIIGVFTILRTATFWYADSRYALGYRQIRAGVYGQAIPALLTAIALNPAEPTYHDELGSAYATLSVAAFEANNATQAAQLATLAVQESDKAINTSPHNVNYFKTRTKVYYTLASLEPSFNAKAIEALTQARTLSPNDPKIYYNLAILVGRDGEAEKAISYLMNAKNLKPNYRDAYYALWVFYTDEKKPEEARKVLQEYLSRIDPKDADFLERVK